MKEQREKGKREFSPLHRATFFLIAVLFAGGLLGLTIGVREFAPPIFSVAEAVDVANSPDGWADENACVNCHEQAEQFDQTGHANTLVPASDADSLKLLAALAASEVGQSEQASVEITDGNIMAVCETGGVVQRAEIDWCFGSGKHARTWVGTLPDSFGALDLLEMRWTWYRSTDSFDVTPGQPKTKGHGAVATLGTQFDAPRAWRCFSCHATRLPAEHGCIETANIAPGVMCQRCHGPRKRHVEAEGAFHDPHWQTSDRMDAVNLCAECHRRPEEQKPGDIHPDNPEIARFQPVGLSQSTCFINSEMTCTTCHDPHKPMSAQDSLGKWQCVQCHDPEDASHTLCAAGRMDDCVSCHMPAIKQESPVSFTDHWIRVRDFSEQRP